MSRNPFPSITFAAAFPPSRCLTRHATWAAVWVCVLIVGMNHGALVRAQFVANPFPILDTSKALVFEGLVGDRSGHSVTGVNDMNGDGVDDFAIGTPFANPLSRVDAGQVHLVFGRNAGTPWTPNPIVLNTQNNTVGVKINGGTGGDNVGRLVAGVHDVNGDGCSDLLIRNVKDAAHLVFGRNTSWPSSVNLIQGQFVGVTFFGLNDDRTGSSMSAAGDVNHDGRADIIMGVDRAITSGGALTGRVDVLFGRPQSSPWPELVNLTAFVNSTTGFSVLGENAGDNCGEGVAGVGDVNGDGVDDVAVSCSRADPHGVPDAGIVAVVFGSATALPEEIAPSQLNGTNGFVVNGYRNNGQIGTPLSRIGDVNGDGLDDLAIGAHLADANGRSGSGEVFVLFGRNSSVAPWPAQVNLSSVNGNNGFSLTGEQAGDHFGTSISGVRDVNADGVDDMLIGADYAGVGDRGLAFLLYGRAEWPATQNSADFDDNHVVTFEGSAANDRCGKGVGFAGDVNGDARGDLIIGCIQADPVGKPEGGKSGVVFGPLFTAAPTTAPTDSPSTASPTAPPTPLPVTQSPTPLSVTQSPTPSTCVTEGAFIPSGATCVNGFLVTSINTTAPAGTAVTVTTSVTITGGASFEQPSGSTLVFVAGGGGGGGGSTSIAVEGGGCASIGGDAVVYFEADPSNGGANGNTGTLVLVRANCVMGKFGVVSATTSFEGDECVAFDEAEQQSSGSAISVTFGVRNACGKNSSGLSTAALAGIGAAGVVVVTVIVVVGVKLARRKRERRAQDDVRMSRRRTTMR